MSHMPYYYYCRTNAEILGMCQLLKRGAKILTKRLEIQLAQPTGGEEIYLSSVEFGCVISVKNMPERNKFFLNSNPGLGSKLLFAPPFGGTETIVEIRLFHHMLAYILK